jgi:hypothetical protein
MKWHGEQETRQGYKPEARFGFAIDIARVSVLEGRFQHRRWCEVEEMRGLTGEEILRCKVWKRAKWLQQQHI